MRTDQRFTAWTPRICKVLPKIIDYLLRQYFTDIEQAYLGEICQSGLEIGNLFIEDELDGLQAVFEKKYSNI